MKLILKQRVFSWLDKYDIYNENQEVMFHVQGKMAFGRKLEIYNNSENHIASIEQKIASLLPTYRMFLGGAEVGKIKKEFTFFRPKFIVDYKGWDVEGDFWDWNYQIKSGNNVVANISKEFFAFSDVYVIDVLDESNILESLMVVLTIDAIKDDSSQHSN